MIKLEKNRFPDKPEIQYPTKWIYKVMGSDRKAIEKAVSNLVDCPYTIQISNRSKQGKYISLNLSLTVMDESHRNSLYRKLADSEAIKMVL